jgi:hypothetical protein
VGIKAKLQEHSSIGTQGFRVSNPVKHKSKTFKHPPQALHGFIISVGPSPKTL